MAQPGDRVFRGFAAVSSEHGRCATGHYWARELRKLGHEVRLRPAKDVKAHVTREQAICEAVRRPTGELRSAAVDQGGGEARNRLRKVSRA